ncbi:hypothetical protein MY1884_007048, partial [Beauveria asiatica]
MAECLVFQVILLREGLAIFIQYEPIGSSGGGGSVFLFAGTGQEPRCAVGDVATSLMRHPEYAGCKLLGSVRRDRVDEAWALCRAHVEDERHKHACVTGCMAVAVAHALMRTIRRRPTDTPSSLSPPPPPLPPSSSPPSLPDGLVFEAHQDTQLLAASSSSSSATTTQPLPPPDTPLSIATALVGLVAASHHTLHDILDLPLAPPPPPPPRSRTTASLQTLRRAVQSLKLTAPLALKWLRRVESAPDLLPTSDDRPALVDVDALIVIVSEAVDAVSAAGKLLVAVVREAAASTTTTTTATTTTTT